MFLAFVFFLFMHIFENYSKKPICFKNLNLPMSMHLAIFR